MVWNSASQQQPQQIELVSEWLEFNAVLYSLTEIETETEMFCKTETKYKRESEHTKRNSNWNENDFTTKMVT